MFAHKWFPKRVTLLLLFLLVLSGCGRDAGQQASGDTVGQPGPVITAQVIPTQASEQFELQMQKLGEFLSRESGLQVQVQIATDYAAVVETMRFGRSDVAFFGPFTYVVANAQSGAQAFVTQNINGKPYYHSYLIVPKDSPIPDLKENADFVRHLKGRRVAFGDPSSTSSSLIPRLALKRAGLDWEKDIQANFTGHHDAVLGAVAANRAAIGAIDSAIFLGSLQQKMPAEFGRVRVVWQSAPLYQYPWAHRRDLDPAVVAKLQQAFLKITDKDVLSAFGADGFIAADDAHYQEVRDAGVAMGIDLQQYSLKK